MSARPKASKTTVPAATSPASPVFNPESAMLGVLGMFSSDALSRMMIEAFALAFERQMQGKGFQALIDTLQLTADLRLFKEGLFLNREQVCRLLGISENTFLEYKKRYAGFIEQDNHLGTHNPRYTLEGVLAARQRLVLIQADGVTKRRTRVA